MKAVCKQVQPVRKLRVLASTVFFERHVQAKPQNAAHRTAHAPAPAHARTQDSDAAYLCCCDYAEPACVIVKHTNPCGVAVRGDLKEAYRLAVRADPISAFGGIVAFNREVDAGAACLTWHACMHVRLYVCVCVCALPCTLTL